MAAGGAHQVPGAQNVIADRLQDVRFHHGHMLVGRRVEDRFHAVPQHDLGEPVGLADIAERGHQLQFRVFLAQLVFDAEEVALGLVESDQAGRLEARHLAAELRADGARGAGDQHRTAGDRGLHLGLVQAYLLAAEQILHRRDCAPGCTALCR